MHVLRRAVAAGQAAVHVHRIDAGADLGGLREVSEISLAVSLHAPNDELRNELVPINRKYPIAELLAACRHYIADKPHRRITWEYVLIDGVNDSEQHARALAALIRDIPSKVNLIPFNPFPATRIASVPKISNPVRPGSGRAK